MSAARRRGPRIAWLLLGANALGLAAPLAALAAFGLYDRYLVRQTERQIMTEAVLIGEAWRDALFAERAAADPAAARAPLDEDDPGFRPPGRETERFTPFRPVLEFLTEVGPPQPPPLRRAEPADTPELRAAQRLVPMLRRSQVFNLNAVRILDGSGCVLATTRGEEGDCLDHLPEVGQALAGRYDARARRRISDEPRPPIGDVRSRGEIRVFIALPVFEEGRVIGVVRASRTSPDALSSLWTHRRGLLVACGASLAAIVATGLLCARAIARPLRALTRTAEAVARGDPAPASDLGRFAPAEVGVLHETLETMTRRLSEQARFATDYAAHVTHELRTPLTSARGAAELLRESWEAMDDAQRRRFLGNIEADVARMERTIGGLLTLARIENAPLPSREVALEPFLRDLLADRGPVELRLSDAPPTLRIDPEHLAIAVGNLVDNALRHGTGYPVSVTVSRAAERVEVRVTNRGPAIPERARPHVFDRFFTTEAERGGTGLGLAIVKAVAEARGGSVTCASGPDGTTFVLTL